MEIDDLMTSALEQARAQFPKSPRVLDIVTSAQGPIGASEVAEILGASRPTAQRYLASLVSKQLLDLDLSYGATGRPEHRYLPRRR